MSKSLSLIVAEMSQLVTSVVEAEGELSPELEAMLDGVSRDLAVKADNYALFMERLDSEADFWKARAQKMSQVAASCANLKERLNGAIKTAMTQLQTTEIVGEETKFKLTRMAPKLVIDELTLPMDYQQQKITYTPDKAKIKADLEAGHQVTGAALEEVFALRKYAARKT